MGQASSSPQRADSLQQHHTNSGTRSTRTSGGERSHPGFPSARTAAQSNSESERAAGHSAATGLNTHPLPSSESQTSPTSRSAEIVDTMPREQEGRPLGELESRNTSRTFMSTTSARSRQSTMSRLGSRLLPNSVVRGLLTSGEETPAEGRAHRTGLFSRSSSRTDNSHNSHRFPSFSNISSRGIARRRSIRGPYPLPRGEAALLPDSPPNPTVLDSPTSERRGRSSRFGWRHRARFSHVRNSIASPISHIFGQPQPPGADSTQTPASPPRRPSRTGFAEDADHLLPSLANMDTHMDPSEPHELDSVEPSARAHRPNSSTSPPRTRPSTSRSPPTRLRRREEQTPLSRILHLAAATIAAQLSGNAAPSGPGIQSLGPDGLDGPLESLLQGLQGANSRRPDETGADGDNGATNTSGLPQVNFLRVFRFVNSNTASGGTSNPQETASDRMDVDGQDSGNGENDRRLLTLVVVGVRSMPSNNGSRGENGSGGRLNLESLMPLLSPSNLNRNDRGSSGLPRRTDRRSRSSRHSVGSGSVPSNYYSQQRSQASSRRQSDSGSSGDLAGSLPTVFTESPAGPNPPPSTPAEANLSRVASGANTPSRRPSSASAFLPQLNEDLPTGSEEANNENSSTFNFPRQRRRSDSEAARHRGLGSGAARRNGVVEPDNPSQSATRSWLIYVIGTNLAENHPAFATPSLFTDNPTYEDMILLSSLLGPAKPPVASQEEVASAGGVYRLTEYHGVLVAEPMEEGENTPIAAHERCLICLSDYEAGEEVRKLTRCEHLYHRECIDEWLLTGRNSCPLCRGEGVADGGSGGEQGVGPSQSSVSG